jgi:hypothetical protein
MAGGGRARVCLRMLALMVMLMIMAMPVIVMVAMVAMVAMVVLATAHGVLLDSGFEDAIDYFLRI